MSRPISPFATLRIVLGGKVVNILDPHTRRRYSAEGKRTALVSFVARHRGAPDKPHTQMRLAASSVR